MSEQSNSKRIAKNTLMLYFRQILIMLVSLYTVRVVLNVLGAEDYGIYNVVAGVVTMFKFLANSMATASQRYFSFDLGKENFGRLKKTFSITFQIYLLLIVIVLLLAETLGLWFVNEKLVIPESRIKAANWIYQVAIISFCFTLISSPYMASIIAHERMNVYAYVSIIEVLLQLLIVFVIKITGHDKLMTYGTLLALVSVINMFMYYIYARKKFPECKFSYIRDGHYMRELISYSSWNLFGASIGVFKNQIGNIILNLNAGVVVNAARGIAFQVTSAVNSFVANFSTALRPQIIKSYASNNKQESLYYVYLGSKLSYSLLYLFIMPLSLEMEFVLTLWLKQVPEYVVIFTRLALLSCLLDSLSLQIMTLAQATGRIKLYQAVVGSLALLNVPLYILGFKLGYGAEIMFVIDIIISFITLVARLIIIKQLTDFSISEFFVKSIMPCFLETIVSLVVVYFVYIHVNGEWLRFFVVCLTSSLVIILSFIFMVLSKKERMQLKSFVYSKVRRNN